MKKWRRLCGALCAAAQLLCLSGCTGTNIFSEFHEIEKIEIIRTIGIDLSETGLVLTADSGVGLDAEPPRLYRQEAATLAAAIATLENRYPDRQPFFTHTETLLLGERAARAGVDGWLDYVARSPKMRLMIDLVVVRGGEAGGAMEAVMSEQSSASDMLEDIAADMQMLGAGFATTCGQTAVRTLESGCALVQAVACTPANGSAGAETMLVPSGFALLRDGRLVGFLEPELSPAVNALTGRFEAANAVVGDAQDVVSLHITKAKTEYTPVYRDGRLERVDIALAAEADVAEISGTADPADAGARAALEKAAADRLCALVQETLDAARAQGGDYLGIGDFVERAAPVRFRAMPETWREIFDTVELRVSARVALRRTYDMNAPMTAEGGNDGE